MKKRTFLTLLTFGSIALSGCYVDLGFIKIGKKESEQQQEEQKQDDQKKEESKDVTAYYSTIDSSLSGDSLLSALRTLNLSYRETEVGYKAMGTDPTGKFKFTDYDPATAKTNKDGVKYGTKILSFYSGKSSTSFNREHVWPDSRGGNIVEDDIFMTRPTITEENSSRGNSAYITGMETEHNGWDPVTAFGSGIGVYDSIRGECARIIFYCMTVSSSLKLSDDTSTVSNTMGSLTNLIEWACENPVNDRERRRNDGGQYLQGNRNAFVDHPEYACKIWGGTNAKTKSACQKANYATN